MYSFAIEGLRPPAPFNSTIARMQYDRVRRLPSGLFSVEDLGCTMVETASPTVTGIGFPPDFEIVDFGESELQQIYRTEQTEVDSLEALVSSASEAWRKLLEKSEVRLVRMHTKEVRKPIENPDGLVVVSSIEEAAAYMDGGTGPSEFSHFIANQDEQDAMRRITESIPRHTPGQTGHSGPYL